ncbi:MAG: hypothetical protein QG610_2228, partial [Euryarchaeota archaeon]|nr:hypothetical protein [Euryarchaeota archaeon]
IFKSHILLNASTNADIKMCLFLVSGHYSKLSKNNQKNELFETNFKQ